MEKLNGFETHRQVFHILFGLAIVILLLYGFLNKETILGLILIGTILSFLSRRMKVPIIYNLLQKFEREAEIKKFPGKGIIFYLIGIYASLVLFPMEVAMASIMVLALGDSISHLYGLHYGKTRHPLSKTKFLEGTIAGLVAGFIGALIFLPLHEAFFASLAAIIIEGIEIKLGTEQVDDNLVVPVVAGTTVWIIRLA